MLTKSQNIWNKVALLNILDGAHAENPETADNFSIQKLSFISELNGRLENLRSAYYKFFRYKNGPYSSGLANDVRQLESLGLIDPESRVVTDRGRFFLDYAQPEVEESDTAKASLQAINNATKKWGKLRGWQIVDAVYALSVPVDDLNGTKMKVSDIPLHTDILVPWKFSGRDAISFSEDMVSDLEAELSIPAAHLDPDSPELLARVSDALEAALTF